MSMKVADFSDWQKGISFSELAKKFSGVIVKIGEGRTPSECYADYAKQAEAAGMKYGFYLYARALTAEEAEEEAVNVLHLYRKNGLTPRLGIWYDVEAPEIVGENGGEGIGAVQITDNISKFISTLNANKVYAGVYAPWWVIRDRILTSTLSDYVPYWVSWVGAHNPLDNTSLTCAGWQNRVDGVNGIGVGDYFVDGSEWYID